MASRATARQPVWEAIKDSAPYTSKHNTIGHRVLCEDRRAEPFPDLIFQRLDGVIDAVANVTIRVRGTSTEEARKVLTRVEDVVREANFVCSIPYYLVESFSDGLFQKPLDLRLIDSAENSLRKTHMMAHQHELFSHVDCDLGALLYLSIGEVLGIPLQMIEVPDHNFVRWRLDRDVHLNWDTNYGFAKFSDTEYAARYGVRKEHIDNGVYLADMSVDNVVGYFSFVRGLTFQGLKRLPEAVAEYRVAIPMYPKSPSARNNIAWLFVSDRGVQLIVSKDEALRFALEACSLHRSDSNLDTLACVHAEHGDFASAIACETEAYNIGPNPYYLKMISAFETGKTWLDVN
jgi:tetratricopeptide (TPR) repeat protein